MKTLRKIIEIDEDLCDGCGECLMACAEGALEIVDGKAKVISDHLCDGLGACMGECPQGALAIVDKETEEFDEEAVEKHLAGMEARKSKKPLECGCPSGHMEILGAPPHAAPEGPAGSGGPSALSHWPVKIRLVSPDAPFLKGADLLVMADCVPVAHPSIHRDLMAGKVVMIGCPKFDDAQAHIDKLADIFSKAGVKSVTCAMMEVPCCSAFPAIVKKGMEKAGKDIPVREIVVGKRGDVAEAGS